jgi:periplasmic copper chaperone A
MGPVYVSTMLKLLLALALLTAPPATAQEDRLGDLVVRAAWAAPSSLSRRTGSVYLTIENRGARDDQLIAAHTDAAEETELRSHRTGEVVGRARRVSAVRLPASQTVVLKPGAEHVALIDVKTPLKAGDRLSLLLMFEKSGLLTVSVPVAAAVPDERKPN